MKATHSFVTSLLGISIALATHAQTAPPPAAGAQPKPRAKTTAAKKGLPASTKKNSRLLAAQDTQQVGQKFIRHSHEDTRPFGLPIPPRKVN